MNEYAPGGIDAHDREIKRRLVAHLSGRTTDQGEAPAYLSPSTFTDPARFDAERAEIFLKMPMFAGLSVDMPNPGDMMLFEALGPSILIVRTRSGGVAAFLNMCSHRGAKLVVDCDSRTRLTCPFHGWTYDLDGKLIGVPRREAFDPGDLASRRLVRLPAGEWAGMIFVKANGDEEAIDVEAHLGSLAERIAALRLDRLELVRDIRIDFHGNWKYAVDTANEIYHIATLHRKTFGHQFVGDSTATELHGLHNLQVLAQKNFTDDGEFRFNDVALDVAMVHHIFPNLHITKREFTGGTLYVNMLRMFPGDTVDRSFLLDSFYKSGNPVSEADVAGFDNAIETLREDLSICAGVQGNLRHAPQGFRSVFGRNEFAAPAVHRNIARIIGMPLDDMECCSD